MSPGMSVAEKLKRPSATSMITLLSRRANETGLIFGLAFLFAVFSATAPNFLTTPNLLNVLRTASFVGIVAWPMTMVIISAEIDISVGPAVAFASVLLALLNARLGLPLLVAVVPVLCLGVVLGMSVGLLRVRLNVPSFITTLALWSGLRGMAQLLSNAVPVVIPNEGFEVLGNGSFLGVPIPGIIMLSTFVVFYVVLTRTTFGRHVYAVGGNTEAAAVSGISVLRTKMATFALTGLCAALTGIIVAARVGSGNSGAADGLEFDVIASVVIGGTSLFGGRGSLVGTLLGVLFITTLGNGLVLLGVTPFAQTVLRGFIILGAVLLNVLTSRD